MKAVTAGKRGSRGRRFRLDFSKPFSCRNMIVVASLLMFLVGL